jgi:hypothetical protein
VLEDCRVSEEVPQYGIGVEGTRSTIELSFAALFPEQERILDSSIVSQPFLYPLLLTDQS